VSVFSDKEIVRMATEDYIPVVGDDWYQRRRQDAEGDFFRKVADQGRPRRQGDTSTRQGIYVFTASGKLLAYKNAQDADVMRTVLQRGLAEWQRLPASQRRPGLVYVEDLKTVDAGYTRTPPPGGLIAKVYTRILDVDRQGDYCKGSCGFTGGDQAARDHLWLTRTECQSLIPKDAKQGDEFDLPRKIADRITRFHLIDNTRGEPPLWKPSEVRKANLKLKVEEITEKTVRLHLEGEVLLATDADPSKATRGYEANLVGTIVYDVERKAITRFDLLALGDHWGRGQYTGGSRPGRKPLGVVFELASGDKPADLVPPQAAREFDQYMGK
jgi:hypothetical protein